MKLLYRLVTRLTTEITVHSLTKTNTGMPYLRTLEHMSSLLNNNYSVNPVETQAQQRYMMLIEK